MKQTQMTYDDFLAALVPPPRLHRHRYFGVLAPNSPLRTSVTALALAATTSPPAPNAQPAAEPAHRRAARYAWALLLARIYEVFPLLCPLWRRDAIIAFITDAPRATSSPTSASRRATPHRARPRPALWEAVGAEHEPTPDPALPPIPAFEFDQRIAW